jgi:peptidoglycan-associated lipoprotein
MTVKTIKLALAAFSVAGLVACGGNDKKPDTTPEPVEQAPAQDTSSNTTAEPTDTSTSEPAKHAELGEVIYFEFDSSELSDQARQQLTENAEWLKEDDARTLTIEGHTDESGTAEYNVALGERRARATKEYLVRLGIAGDRIEIISYGEERPASDKDELNRRSVFVATKK